jgi:hypothetical protein
MALSWRGADDIYAIGISWKDDHTLIVDLPRRHWAVGFDHYNGSTEFEVNGIHIEYRTF